MRVRLPVSGSIERKWFATQHPRDEARLNRRSFSDLSTGTVVRVAVTTSWKFWAITLPSFAIAWVSTGSRFRKSEKYFSKVNLRFKRDYIDTFYSHKRLCDRSSLPADVLRNNNGRFYNDHKLLGLHREQTHVLLQGQSNESRI
jgi:hypothetical protein